VETFLEMLASSVLLDIAPIKFNPVEGCLANQVSESVIGVARPITIGLEVDQVVDYPRLSYQLFC
jgi:aspartate ammonia-lyase